jgi:NAD(P)-dependent dehydrogenase (short-subunit alcohol dehydrogenase family)
MTPGQDERLGGPVVVTGAAHGIGRGVALACARGGAPVAVLDVDGEAVREVMREARSCGAPAAVGVACDVTREAAVAAAVDQARRALGPLRGLVTSAAIDRRGSPHDVVLADWLSVLDVNLTGTLLACKHVLGDMLAHGEGGSIVCVSSPFARVSAPGGAAPYCASKGGVSALMRSMALDYAPRIRVNAVLPGPVDTALMWAGVPDDEIPALRDLTGGQMPLGRLGEVDEIAAAVTWLLSDRSSYVTGSELVVDGGLLARAHIDQ